MIPILFDNKGKKIGDLAFCLSGYAIEERNGMCEIEIEYLTQQDNVWDKIANENIIVADLSNKLKNQKFRIYKTTKAINRRIKIFAKHITYDLEKDLAKPMDVKGKTVEEILKILFQNSQFSKHYKGYSTVVIGQDYKIDERSLIKAIIGQEGSIVDTFRAGIEIKRDNENIHVMKERGRWTGIEIEYGKNLTGFECDEDMDGLCTKSKAFAKSKNSNGEEIIVYSKPEFVDSPYVDRYGTPYIQVIDFSDKFKDPSEVTGEKLKEMASHHFRLTQCDVPKLNYKIDFVPLSRCAGYEDLEDDIELCDTVLVRNSVYNLLMKSKVVKTKYNFLADRMEKLELGNPKLNIGSQIGDQIDSSVGNAIGGVNSDLGSLKNDICNLRIGGYNYVVKSDNKLQSNSNDKKELEFNFTDKNEIMKFLKGQDITISCEIETDDVSAFESAGVLFKYQLEGSKEYQEVKAEVTEIEKRNGKYRVWATFRLP